jgi:hypothetical protein
MNEIHRIVRYLWLSGCLRHRHRCVVLESRQGINISKFRELFDRFQWYFDRWAFGLSEEVCIWTMIEELSDFNLISKLTPITI